MIKDYNTFEDLKNSANSDGLTTVLQKCSDTMRKQIQKSLKSNGGIPKAGAVMASMTFVSATPIRPGHRRISATRGSDAIISPQTTIAPETDITPVTNVQPVVNVLPTDYNDYSRYGDSGYGEYGYGDYLFGGPGSSYNGIGPDAYDPFGGYWGYGGYGRRYRDYDWYRRPGWQF
ncbi:hypothetical protein BGX26_009921 [Mortierella sp. AD094]|nr:hypothetical protein BGX26_009921 [Mortierella sp. AD094]